MSDLESLYGCCTDHRHEHINLAVSDSDADALFSKLLAMIERVWKQKSMPEKGIDIAVVAEYADRLWTGVTEGYGLDFPSIDFNTPDLNTLAKLKESCWQFSAAKNYQQLSAISRELVDANGKIRPFNEFRDAAVRINIEHVRHLETEYNTAIAGGQMAGLWVEVKEQSEVLPYVQFEAVLDGNTTDLCRSLDGVIVRWDSPILKKYWPPNHYGCRLTIRRLANAVETPLEEIPLPDIPKIFQTNLGEQGLAFPEDHPYFTGLPDRIRNNAIFVQDEADQYILETFGNGRVRTHITQELAKKSDYESLRKVAKELAEQKQWQLDILPEIHAKEPELRERLLPDTIGVKNPDLRINGKYWEHEKPTEASWKSVERRVKEGAKQANRVLIELDGEFGELENMAKGRFRALDNLKEILFRTPNGQYIHFMRP